MATKQRIKGPATVQFDAKVRELTSRGVERMRACELVARRNSELHRTMIVEQNMGATDTTTLAAVLDGSQTIHAPVQRPGVSAKQTTAKPMAGTATRQPATKASTVTTVPTAPVAPAAAATQQSPQARLDAALAKRHSAGLDGSLAVLDLLESPTEAHLWHDVKVTTACA
jgi:hypothetical protein